MFKVRLSTGEIDTWTSDEMGRASMSALTDGLCYRPDEDGIYSIGPIEAPETESDIYGVNDEN